MTETSGEYQIRTFGNGASYVTSSTSAGVWLVEPEGATLAEICDAVVAFAHDYPDKRVLQVRIIHMFDDAYIGMVDAEG